MMYDSGVTAQNFLLLLDNEIDVPSEFSTVSFSALAESLNKIEQILYRNIIKEIIKVTVSATENKVTHTQIQNELSDDYAMFLFDDIVLVKADNIQLTKCALDKFNVLRNVYCTNGDVLEFKKAYSTDVINDVDIYLKVCPALKEVSNEIVTGNVMVPYEFLSMVAAFIRGEQYKLINEDNIAAKWIADFNAQLESFKSFIVQNSAKIG